MERKSYKVDGEEEILFLKNETKRYLQEDPMFPSLKIRRGYQERRPKCQLTDFTRWHL